MIWPHRMKRQVLGMVGGLSAFIIAVGAVPATGEEPKAADDKKPPVTRYRGELGADSNKVKSENGKTLIWAGGGDPQSDEALWYDFTGSPIATEDLQFGIGKDRIRSIDDPLYVKPDDKRLLALPVSPYRPDERPKTSHDIRVIGFVHNGEARAFPTALLDRHELVNDVIGGKPVTVGW